ncbi:hypothetical protein ACVWWO_002708 [Bradyrhizobium sp. F1.13.1]
MLNRLLAASSAPWIPSNSGIHRSNWGRRLTTIQYLEDQAARAERLAKRITDTLTIEKLLTFAGERRREIEVIAGKYRRA